MKITDAKSYIDKCKVLEKSENLNILNHINTYFEELQRDIQYNTIGTYYNHPKNMGEDGIKHLARNLERQYEIFRIILRNIKFLPILPPVQTIKSMVDETYDQIPDELKIKNIYFKNISDFNFTESKMRAPDFSYVTMEKIERSVGPIPNVLSMSVIYHNNPLMWPLIFNEYGHSIYDKLNSKYDIEIEICKRLKICCDELEEDFIDSLYSKDIVKEIFSDIFAVRHQSLNYFLAFYFHEILNSSSSKLLNIPEATKYNSSNDNIWHPPSVIRMKYLLSEIEKMKCRNNEILTELLKLYNPCEKINYKEYKKYILFFDTLYNVVCEVVSKIGSKLFDNTGIIDFEIAQNLYGKLQERYPIGTSFSKGFEENMLVFETKKGEEFNLEKRNRVPDIIYAGWISLIKDRIINFQAIPNDGSHFDYIIKKYMISEEDCNSGLVYFTHEYKYLCTNLAYSIETSVVVSNYMK